MARLSGRVRSVAPRYWQGHPTLVLVTYQMVESCERFVYRHAGAEAVDLIEINRIDTQPLETRFTWSKKLIPSSSALL